MSALTSLETMMPDRRKFLSTTVATALLAVARGALAHGAAGHAATAGPETMEQQEWGVAGSANDVRRTIAVTMSDDMRFRPDQVTVGLGETVRFTLHNKGKILHEMVIGTPAALAEHAELMMKFPDMEHAAPWMSHVPPGHSGEIVWTFNRPGEFQIACLIPGHYQAGMVGKVVVK